MTLLTFNMLLGAAGIVPADVCLVRHQKRLPGRPTPYAVWARDRADLELYQSCQAPKNRGIFSRPYWASFVAAPDDATLFVGLYATRLIGAAPYELIDPVAGDRPAEDAEPADLYDCQRIGALEPYAGLLKIEWGDGTRAWKQYASRRDKPIVELAQRFTEPEFPGYTRFLSSFMALPSIPASWINALRAVKGVYLLSCPRSREQYVGSATGEDGFWGRWSGYVATGHGGNEGLRSRDPEDYCISILEVAGSAATSGEILAMEALWKQKLRSREMGVNRN